MAVQACTRLLGDLLTLSEGLVRQHVGVPPILAKIPGEGIARPHRLQPRVLFEARLGDNGARVGLCGGAWYGLAATEPCALLVNRAQIGIVLQRKVLPPEGWIGGLVVQIDDAIERISGFLLTLEDVDQQRCTSSRQNSR